MKKYVVTLLALTLIAAFAGMTPASAEEAASQPAVSSDATNPAPASTAVTEEVKKPWGIKTLFQTITGISGSKEADLKTDTYVTGSYTLPYNLSTYLQFPFSANYRDEGKLSLGDVKVGLSRADLYTIEPWGVTLNCGARLSLPTSEASRKAETYTVLRGNLGAAKQIGKVGLAYTVYPYYYFQKWDWADEAKSKLNKNFGLVNEVGAEYALTEKLSLSAGANLQSFVTHSGHRVKEAGDQEDVARTTSNLCGLEAGAAYALAKNVSLGVGLSSEAPTAKFAVNRNTTSANFDLTLTF
ncbi:MAG: hypothetical protein HY391_01650 [Deltaproteobacteria bacterium]|nr:hypothetical protein [Deltaproteobacteria bacterium]